MTLQEKRENLKGKKVEILKKKSEIKKLEDEVTTKEVTMSDEEFRSLSEKILDLENAITEISEETVILEEEVRQEDSTAKKLKEELMKTKSLGDEKIKKENYLKTKESLEDFAKILRKTGGKTALKEAWKEHLQVKGITNPDILLPQAVISSITDAFDKAGTIFSTFRYTGLTMLKTAINSNVDPVTSRARGHKKGVAKGEQEITLVTKEIRAQYIYKYITLDRETLRENQDTGALIKYILEELPQRIILEIEKAAMIGDQRSENDDNKITSFEPIARPLGADDPYTSYQVATANLLEDLIKMDATITAPGNRYLVVSRKTLAELKLSNNQGGLVFPIGSDIASALGYTAIFTPDFMSLDPMDPSVKAIEYVGDAYKTVGDNTMDSFENFELSQNKNEYLMEIYSGGALDAIKSSAILVNP